MIGRDFVNSEPAVKVSNETLYKVALACLALGVYVGYYW